MESKANAESNEEGPAPLCRYERKFVVSAAMVHQATCWVRVHPKAFRTAYPPRNINNIYFDTRELDHYHGNVAGDMQRKKIRIRWYGDFWGDVARPVLEFKEKRGLVGFKNQYPLAPFTLTPELGAQKILESVAASELPPMVLEELMLTEPTIMNRYHRAYFESMDRAFRVTIDKDIIYKDPAARRHIVTEGPRDPNLVLELKYGLEHDEEAAAVSSAFPIRLSRNSKYINGMALLYHD